MENRVLLAPMAGVTDAPFRALVSRLGAGLVVSEMTASDALIAGRRNAVLRAEGHGEGLHVVQLAGCEPHWMAEGARIAEGAGADCISVITPFFISPTQEELYEHFKAVAESVSLPLVLYNIPSRCVVAVAGAVTRQRANHAAVSITRWVLTRLRTQIPPFVLVWTIARFEMVCAVR